MLDADQKKAAHSFNGDLFIAAPAGSGKTRVLVERVSRLVKVKKVPPEHILVLTFARRAAAEIRSRFERHGLTGVVAKTFHAWAYGLARSIHAASPELINDEQKNRVLRRILAQLLARSSARYFKREAKRLNWSLTYLAGELITTLDVLRQFGWTRSRTIAAIGQKKINWPFSTLLINLWCAYDELLLSRQAFDFNLLLDFTKRYLLAHPAVLRGFRTKYRYVLVDEIQDANQQELALIDLLAAEKSHLTFVGDPNQAVYAWRGSSSKIRGSRARSLGRLSLKTNYRSDKCIIDLVNDFYNLNIKAAGPAINRPVCIWHHRYAEEQVLGRLIPELNALGYANREILILSRAHNPLEQIKKIRKEFAGLRLATVHAVKGLEARVVILINCSRDRFGFPLPGREAMSPIIDRLAQYDQAREEKRIFYVAMTRAKERLIFLGDINRPSPYLKQFKKKLIKFVKIN